MWAMSATSTAPTSWAISAKAAKSMVRGMAVPPQKMSLGRSLAGQVAHLVEVDAVGRLARTPYCTLRNHLPVTTTFQPWVRCPPMDRSMPMTVSPGSRKATYTARLAGEPE